jgi:hypothetical protein
LAAAIKSSTGAAITAAAITQTINKILMIRRLAGHPGKSTHYPMIFSPLCAKCGSLH